MYRIDLFFADMTGFWGGFFKNFATCRDLFACFFIIHLNVGVNLTGITCNLCKAFAESKKSTDPETKPLAKIRSNNFESKLTNMPHLNSLQHYSKYLCSNDSSASPVKVV